MKHNNHYFIFDSALNRNSSVSFKKCNTLTLNFLLMSLMLKLLIKLNKNDRYCIFILIFDFCINYYSMCT